MNSSNQIQERSPSHLTLVISKNKNPDIIVSKKVSFNIKYIKP